MHLGKLVQVLVGAEVSGSKDIDVSGIVYDSRQAFSGCLFCCIEGLKFDGHQFAKDAVEHGAIVLCLQKEVSGVPGITIIKVPDTREALAQLAAEFYGHPSRKLKVIGVTGTNGKTTTTFLIEHIFEKIGRKAGLMGTLFVKIADIIETTKHTTPESLDLQNTLARMVVSGMEYAVLEVSSHALSLKRVNECTFERAVFTNLTQDHLDFHESLEDYFRAKLKLFTLLKKDSGHMAVLNIDDSRSSLIIENLKVPFISYGVKEESCDFRAENVIVSPNGVEYDLRSCKGEVRVRLGISGMFNVYNSLAAIATVCSYGFDLDEVVRSAEDFQGVKGRFQMIKTGQDFSVVVDYAHTPDGLDNILDAARKITLNRLITVFGCGGDRDRAKRPIMGKIAASRSDYVIITSDNPRTEDPEKIITDIEGGVKTIQKKYERIVDRKEAIWKALQMANTGDTIVIAGKGHETYQIFNDRTVYFDDEEVVQEFFSHRW